MFGSLGPAKNTLSSDRLFNASSQFKVGLQLGVFRLKLSNRDLEPIAFLFQGILHALHRCEVFIDSADSDDLSAGIQKRHFGRVVTGDSAIHCEKKRALPAAT
jgi:hypothetical protein